MQPTSPILLPSGFIAYSIASSANATLAQGEFFDGTFHILRLNIPQRLHALPPATFSGGEQQRINLARGFIGRHPVLLVTAAYLRLIDDR